MSAKRRRKPAKRLLRAVLATVIFSLLPALGTLAGGSTLQHAALASAVSNPGYILAGADGSTYPFGTPGFGDTYSYGLTGLSGSHPLAEPIVGMAATPDGKGYWLVAKDGGIFNFGDAGFYGNPYTLGLTGLSGSHPLAEPIVGMAATPDGKGYWLVAKDGGIFNFGDAGFYGNPYTLGLTGLSGSHPLAEPIVGMAATPDGKGYWLVAKDGGIFNFGDAAFEGSMGGRAIAAPVIGFASGFYAPLAVNPIATQVAAQGSPYSLQVSASGGDGSYTWSASGLPPGLAMSASGAITGTPPASDNGQYPATVTVTDSAGFSATETVVFDVGSVSSNWSGYAITGSANGAFTGIQGTFTVPSLTSNQPASCSTGQTTGSLSSTCTTSVWLGIDGFTNQSLIQAGIAEAPIVGGSGYAIWPWWEILPAASTQFNALTINPGDSVTVSITPAAAAGDWSISMMDNTNGQSAVVTELYSGPAANAEWIVEAPTINGIQSTLSPYAPAVQFSHIGYALNAGDTASAPTDILLCQGGYLAAAPGELAGASFQLGYQTGSLPCQ